jgi:MFS family permease
VITLALAGVVFGLSHLTGSLIILLVLLTATRGLGQSALSVASITSVGRRFGKRVGMPMAVFSVLLSVFFAMAFVLVGYSVRQAGWRVAWRQVAVFLAFVIAPMILLFFHVKSPGAAEDSMETSGFSAIEALQTAAFWVFAGSAALFNLVSSGLGLFNEAVLAERGFDQKTFHIFLGVTTLFSLVGQFMAGGLSRKISYRALIALGMGIYATGLALIPVVGTKPQLYMLSAVIGVAGGMIIVVFFAIWSEAFGRRHLGRIQGAAQFMTVISSALGPVLFAKAFDISHSYTPLLFTLAVVVLGVGITALNIKMPRLSETSR